MCTRGFLRNLGDPANSADGLVVWDATLNEPRPEGEADPGRERTVGTGRYRMPKETKGSGMVGRKSEQLIVAMKAGNRAAGTRGSEGAAVSRNC